MTVDEILETKNQRDYSIALDWLSMYFYNLSLLENDYEEGDDIKIDDNTFLIAINRPSQHFKSCYELYHQGEKCAYLLANPRNLKFFETNIVKVDFVNHTLYSGVWKVLFDLLNKSGLKYKSCSRVDIAIDGVSYLHRLMNFYAKQDVGKEKILLKNSSEKRSLFSCKVLNPRTRLFENFNIGSSGGNKMVTIYNKSLEIAKSGKDYIQEYWLKNGVISSKKDIEKQGLLIKEYESKKGVFIADLKGYENVYRFEIRLKSEAIKEIQGFSVDLLTSAKGLASIVRLQTQRYFEAVKNDNNRISRCTPIELLPLNRFGGEKLEKINRVENDGLYKAKLTVHGIIQDFYKGKIDAFRQNEAIELIVDRCVEYRLTDYLTRKLEEWDKKYSPFLSNERLNEKSLFISELRRSCSIEHYSDTISVALMNDNAYATASFGDGLP
jgi:hypothetical protein